MQSTVDRLEAITHAPQRTMRAISLGVVSGLLTLAAAGAVTGCASGEFPTIYYKSHTPGILKTTFRLDEQEWGNSTDVLAIALYTTSDGLAYAWYSFIWCQRVVVLKHDQNQEFEIPDQAIPSGLVLTPVIPRFEKQRRPIVFVCNADGRWGAYHHEPERSDLQFLRLQEAPRLSIRDHKLVHPSAESTSSAMTVDAAFGALICHLLEGHVPGRKVKGHEILQISKANAQLISTYLERHPKVFSETTCRLWNRLAVHYDIPSAHREGEQWDWDVLGSQYGQGVIPADSELVRVLPEREQRLVRGSYTVPDHPYDIREENKRQMIQFLEGRVPSETLEKIKNSSKGVSP